MLQLILKTQQRLNEQDNKPEKVPGYALLKSEHEDSPIYLITRHDAYVNNDGTLNISGLQHRIENHDCPTNWIHQVARVISDKDDDPHGLFKLVKFATKKGVIKLHNDQGKAFEDDNSEHAVHMDYELIFPEAYGAGTIIDGKGHEVSPLKSLK